MIFTTNALKAGTGCNDAAVDKWFRPIQAAMNEFEIKTSNAIAAFLANIGVESGNLEKLVENLNYRAERLAVVWPNRYAIDPKAKVKAPNAKAKALGGNPEAIANDCYAHRMGNGSPESGDGWKFRGRGLIQLTGKEQYDKCGQALGVDLVVQPHRLEEPIGAALSAAWFFKKEGIIEVADSGNFSKVVKMVNGAVPGPNNHGDLRMSRYLAAKRELEV